MWGSFRLLSSIQNYQANYVPAPFPIGLAMKSLHYQSSVAVWVASLLIHAIISYTNIYITKYTV